MKEAARNVFDRARQHLTQAVLDGAPPRSVEALRQAAATLARFAADELGALHRADAQRLVARNRDLFERALQHVEDAMRDVRAAADMRRTL
jgi:hypothetical protein